MALRVSEYFYSIQGEGITMGVPAVFIRLQGCNLLCESKDWICDSIEVWKKGEKIDSEEFADGITNLYGDKLKQGAHLIFTGGEPMNQQKGIVEFLDAFYAINKFCPFVEIETNGTKVLTNDMIESVDLINCSPKLSNAGMPLSRTIKHDSLKQINEFPNSIFKFVIAEHEDILEVKQIIKDVGLEARKIVLMPAADCIEQLTGNLEMVAELCKENMFLLSTRMQVTIWNKTTGV